MATLKISDLSVGDWVRWGERNVQIAEIGQLVYSFGSRKIDFDNRVTLRYKENIPVYCESVMLADLEPIPITAEILEKIGFERLLESDLFYHSESGLEVAFEDGEWMHTINLHEYTIHTISGVHHIQHLLRFYGCEKEINL